LEKELVFKASKGEPKSLEMLLKHFNSFVIGLALSIQFQGYGLPDSQRWFYEGLWPSASKKGGPIVKSWFGRILIKVVIL